VRLVGAVLSKRHDAWQVGGDALTSNTWRRDAVSPRRVDFTVGLAESDGADDDAVVLFRYHVRGRQPALPQVANGHPQEVWRSHARPVPGAWRF
jgi:hypothetical protein